MKKMLVRIWNKAVGSRVKFTDGTVYQALDNGSIVRLSPLKPWNSKAERRQVIKNRREDRLMAAINNPKHLKLASVIA